jgi:hypothetical protein
MRTSEQKVERDERDERRGRAQSVVVRQETHAQRRGREEEGKLRVARRPFELVAIHDRGEVPLALAAAMYHLLKGFHEYMTRYSGCYGH